MKKQILYTAPPLLLVLFLLGIVACRKDEPPQDCPPDLPCATQTGANTFGCYIDGVPWVAGVAPYVFAGWVHPIEAEYDELGYGQDSGNLLRITSSYYDSITNGFLTIYLKPVLGNGIVEHDKAVFSVVANIGKINPHKLIWAFDFDSVKNYRVDITRLDTENNIVSGIFSFDAMDNNDTISVTNGRFDVKYSPR